jgi:hypothetical protein
MPIPLFSTANRNMTHFQITVDTWHHRVAIFGIRLSDRHRVLVCQTQSARCGLRHIFKQKSSLRATESQRKDFFVRKGIYTDDTHCVEAVLYWRYSLRESSERVANFKCLPATVMNQNIVHVELLITLDSTDARFHSVFKITFPCSIKKTRL